MKYLIPNSVVRGSTGSLINQMYTDGAINKGDGDKVLLVFKYIFANTTNSGTMNFTLDDMITECGYIPKSKKGGTNEKFRKILHYLKGCGYFGDQCDVDFLNLKPKEFVRVNVVSFNCDSKGKRSNYFVITDEEIETIMGVNNLDNHKMLLYYANLKSRIYHRTNDSDSTPQVCYASIDTMAKNLLMSKDTIERYNETLIQIGLIYIQNAGKFGRMCGDTVVYRQSSNTYTLTSIPNYKDEVDNAIDIFKHEMITKGWAPVREDIMTKREAAGTINRIEALKKQGEISPENQAKLERAKASQKRHKTTVFIQPDVNSEILDNLYRKYAELYYVELESVYDAMENYDISTLTLHQIQTILRTNKDYIVEKEIENAMAEINLQYA